MAFFFFPKFILCQLDVIFYVFVACWCCEINCTFIYSVDILFDYLSVIRGHLNPLQAVSISIWKTMYMTNTKNVNYNLSVFRAQRKKKLFDSRL